MGNLSDLIDELENDQAIKQLTENEQINLKVADIRQLVTKVYRFFGEPEESLQQAVNDVMQCQGYTLADVQICFEDTAANLKLPASI